MSSPPLPGSQALGTFPHLTTLLLPTACLPGHSSLLHLQVASLPFCLLPMPLPSQFPSPEALPLLFADLSSAIIGGLVQGTSFPPLPATSEAFTVAPAALPSFPGEGLPELG